MSDSQERSFNPVAGLLAWLWPGLGHVSLGHTKRGLLIMAGTFLLVGTGILVGGIDSIDHKDDRLWFYAQAGNGPIAFAVSMANQNYIKTGKVGRLISPNGPVTPDQAFIPGTVNEFTGIAHVNEYATLLSALAGLMNIAVIIDAATRPRWAGPAGDRRKS